MEFVSTITAFSILCGEYALAVLIFGWLLVILLNLGKKGPFDLKAAGPFTKLGLALTLLGVAGVVISIFGFIAAGVTWLWIKLSSFVTPGRLAIYSLIIGVSPLFISALGILLAKLVGGSVDARGPQNCRVMGLEIGGLVYGLFMSYWLTLFTVGLAFAGLLVSAIWVIF